MTPEQIEFLNQQAPMTRDELDRMAAAQRKRDELQQQPPPPPPYQQNGGFGQPNGNTGN